MAREPEVEQMGRVKETQAPISQARGWNRLVPLRKNGYTLKASTKTSVFGVRDPLSRHLGLALNVRETLEEVGDKALFSIWGFGIQIGTL